MKYRLIALFLFALSGAMAMALRANQTKIPKSENLGGVYVLHVVYEDKTQAEKQKVKLQEKGLSAFVKKMNAENLIEIFCDE